jgi:hypothetical protein
MLKAMMCALNELTAGEYPQGFSEDSAEAAKIMRDADKAAEWVAEQQYKREAKRGNVTTAHHRRRAHR